MYELSLAELESELSALLPPRNLMCHRRRRKAVKHAASAGNSASYGSALNADSTTQTNSNPQTVVNTGTLHSAGIKLNPSNTNSNTNQQTGTPLNFGVGL
ncbi:MAG TPA: hypothetical protein VF120_14390 [Ktedonobacterales bacterium]